MQPAQPDDDGNADSERESHEKPALPACRVCEKTERRPRVVHQGDIENGQHRDAFLRNETAENRFFRELVEKYDHERERNPPPAAGLLHAYTRFSPGSDKLMTQRPQSSGCSAFAPTSGRRCQHRTHFNAAVGFTAIHTPPCVALTASTGGAFTWC